ncbi:MAG: DUF1015 domain-containing protein [Bacteroidota bacterium]
MVDIVPFKAIRPTRDKVHLVAARPYYSYKKNVLKAKLEDNSFTFLRIINPEFNQSIKTEPNSKERFSLVREKYAEFIKEKILIRENENAFYIYQQTKNGHKFYGIIAGASIDDYEKGRIKKHEETITSRETLFVSYLDIVGYNAEPVLLSHSTHDELDKALLGLMQERPEYEFTTTDKIKHEVWVIKGKNIGLINKFFEEIDTLYIADGHHRCASSAGLRKKRSKKEVKKYKNENYFLAFIMDEQKMQIVEFNRLIKTLNNLSKEEFLLKLSEIGSLTKLDSADKPTIEHQLTIYIDSDWYTLNFDNSLIPFKDPVKSLDTYLLTELILKPILGIQDLKTDENISYVSGAEPIENIINSVDSKKYKIAFILFPISIEQVKAVADANGIMPPKSTWVEPKLRSGLTIYNINE